MTDVSTTPPTPSALESNLSSIARLLVGVAVGGLVTHGVVEKDQVAEVTEVLTSILVGVAGVIWVWVKNKEDQRNLKAALNAPPPGSVVVSPATVTPVPPAPQIPMPNTGGAVMAPNPTPPGLA